MKTLLLLSLTILSVGCTAQRSSFTTITERNGNVGIGTTTPDEKLTVKGKIHTQEVIVDLKGAVAADYVFEHYFKGASTLLPSYSLPTLEEIEAYTKVNYHLPGVPSAKQMAEEGVSLKRMNLILLQKVEELTLYTLEQQKEINTLKKEVQKLKQ